MIIIIAFCILFVAAVIKSDKEFHNKTPFEDEPWDYKE